MQKQKPDVTHNFFVPKDESSVLGEFFALLEASTTFYDGFDKVGPFLRAHSNLTEDQIEEIRLLIENESLYAKPEILFDNSAEYFRTRKEIFDAYVQARDRRWFRELRDVADGGWHWHADAKKSLEELKEIFPDIDDPKHDTDYHQGVLDGIQSALNWVLGNSWAELEI